jgi:N utilization substance protein A
VEIKAVAREAGSRSKMAVTSHDPNIDAVGACVGQKGTRVNSVMNELGGESIDIIEWDADTEKFIANALSPAKVIDVELNEPEKAAVTYVDPKQLSLAIGRSGQNVRLAAKLTGWKIDVKPFGQPEEPASDAPTPSAEIPANAEE